MTTIEDSREPGRRLPARPVLRPGVHVVRGEPGTIRVCADGEADLVLPDDTVTDTALRSLAEGAGPVPSDETAGRLLHRLAQRGWLTHADLLHDLLRQAAEHRGAVSTLFAPRPQPHTRPDPRCRWAARRTTTVGVAGHRGAARPAAALLAATARELGLVVVEEPSPPERGAPEQQGPGIPDVHVLVSAGEPDSHALDAWLSDSVPYLTVSGHADRVSVGPWVVPGVTACHRCVEAARCDQDPGHARRSEVLGLAPEDPAVPHPADAALLATGAAWAAREVLAYVEGGAPLTWSSTWSWSGDLVADRTRWGRHPRCGCSWGEGLASPAG